MERSNLEVGANRNTQTSFDVKLNSKANWCTLGDGIYLEQDIHLMGCTFRFYCDGREANKEESAANSRVNLDYNSR